LKSFQITKIFDGMHNAIVSDDHIFVKKKLAKCPSLTLI